MRGSFDTAIIGGGASGIVAAISAKRAGKTAVICDHMPMLGKKILASGNGRCNLLNEHLETSDYNPASRPLVQSVFARFGKVEIKRFFGSLGLELYYEDGGRIFPATNQSASVLKVLEMELRELSVPVELNFEVAKISELKEVFTMTAKTGKSISARRLILAGGGRSYPAFGSDGSCYKMAEGFGHEIVEPVPSAVGLVVKDPLCHALQGQKISARAAGVIDGEPTCEALGDLLFAKYGLSGTAILDISEEISIAVNRHRKKDVAVSVDMVPFMSEEKLRTEITERMRKGWPHMDLVAGILPNKFGPAFEGLLKTRDATRIASSLKRRSFKVTGTRGWNEAEFTSGGIALKDIRESTRESRLKKGLYFAGEIMDVTGRRGGYNLAWAWASGYVAGLTG